MKILIGYDGSPYADIAIDDLQRAGLPEKAEAIVLSAVEWPTMQALRSWGMAETDFSPEWIERIEAARKLAEAGANRLQKLFPQWNVQLEPSAGNPADAILEKARAWPAALIVVGTHGRSALGRVLLGSVSLKLTREAPCSVRVARPTRAEKPIRILIGIDASPEADAAVAEVCGRVWPVGTEARILAVHDVLVLNEDEHLRLRRSANQAAEKLSKAGLVSTSCVEEGDPKSVLVRAARDWNADTLFVGARGIGRVEGLLLGSVSSASVAHAACTVEVVRHHS